MLKIHTHARAHLPHLWKPQLGDDWCLHPAGVCLDPAKYGGQGVRCSVSYICMFLCQLLSVVCRMCFWFVCVVPCWRWRHYGGCPVTCCWLKRTCSFDLSVSACTPDSFSLPRSTLMDKGRREETRKYHRLENHRGGYEFSELFIGSCLSSFFDTLQMGECMTELTYGTATQLTINFIID